MAVNDAEQETEYTPNGGGVEYSRKKCNVVYMQILQTGILKKTVTKSVTVMSTHRLPGTVQTWYL